MRRGHVLLVEDDNEVSALTREMLSDAWVQRHPRHQRGRGARRARERAPRSTSCCRDIMMPGGVSGLDLAREIRRRHPHLPIVLTTGYVEAAARMKDGEFALLLKPYSLEALAGALGVE